MIQDYTETKAIATRADSLHKPPIMPRPRLHYHRVFFALTLTEAAERMLYAHQQKLLALANSESAWRFVPPANWHLTLSFIGAVDARQLEQLQAMRCPALSPFSLRFGAPLYFAGARIFGLAPLAIAPELSALAQACEQEKHHLRLAKREHDYVPHITLARAAPAASAHAASELPPGWLLPTAFECGFGEFHLMESLPTPAGVRYRPMQTWALQRPLRSARPH